jgi:hypothetical protein
MQVFKMVNLTRSQEEYQLWGRYDSEPSGKELTQCLQEKIALLLRGKVQGADSKRRRW